MMLECDTVVLFGLTMFKADFIYYAETEIRIKDVTKVNKFIGIGTTMHNTAPSLGRPSLRTPSLVGPSLE